MTKARAPRTLAALALGAAVVAGGACRREPPALEPATVEVTLAWAPPRAPGTEWNNDLGYRVRLDEGWLVGHTVELVRCPARASLVDDVLHGLAGGREAWAGHTSDPSTEPLRLVSPHAQSLGAPASLVMGVLRPPAADYCAAFHLVARALPEVPLGNAPAGVDLMGRRLSIYLRGAYLRPPATAFTPFTAETSSAYGKSATAAGVVAGTPTTPSLHVPPGARLGLRVVRDASGVFDGIDFAGTTPEKLARRVIANVVDTTRIELEAR